MALLVALWGVFGWALYSAWQAKINYKPYDPFEILGIPSNADGDTIKNAFKRLSRLHHPDKAKTEDREKAEIRFVEMSKAYKTLTDEKIRKNWEEYGNPDGVRTFALGVALPSWLVNSGNRMVLLALYCIAFGVGLPLLVKQWWSKSKKYTKDGLRNSSMTMFFHELKENTSLKKLVEILANASEFAEELPEYPGSQQKTKELVRMLKEDYTDPYGDNFELPKKVASGLVVTNF